MSEISNLPDQGCTEHGLDEFAAVEVVQTLYDSGRDLLAKGLPIMPINGKRPCNASGHPAVRWQTFRCHEKRLLRGLHGALDPKPHPMTRRTPAAEPGIGLRMGPSSGIIDVEADSPKEQAAIQDLFQGNLPQTVCFESRRGMHYLFQWDDRLAELGSACSAGNFTFRSEAGDAVTLRIGANKGSQSVIPPTPGRSYLPGCSFTECAVASLPESVIKRLLGQAHQRRSGSRPNTAVSEAPVQDGSIGRVLQSAKENERQPQLQLYTEDSRGHVTAADGSLARPRNCIHSIEIDAAESIASAVARAIEQTLPDGHGQRHRRLFRFARLLKAIPEFTDLEDPRTLRAYVKAWHQAARPHINTKTWEPTWLDFLEGWPRIKHLPRDEPIVQAFEDALAKVYPVAAYLFETEKVQDLVALCAELQRRAPAGKPFYLDCRTIGRLLMVSHTTAAEWMRLLQLEHVIARVTKGYRGKSSEYFYVAESLKSVA